MIHRMESLLMRDALLAAATPKPSKLDASVEVFAAAGLKASNPDTSFGAHAAATPKLTKTDTAFQTTAQTLKTDTSTVISKHCQYFSLNCLYYNCLIVHLHDL